MVDINDVEEHDLNEEAADAALEAKSGEPPEWAKIPPDLKIPPGRRPFFIRFRGELTDAPQKGDRHCIIWSMSDAEENIAMERVSTGKHNPIRMTKEMTKICIRAIDGHRVDWTASGRPGDIRMFWEEIGHKYRQQLMGMHMKMHSLTGEEAQDFLANCIVGVSVVPG